LYENLKNFRITFMAAQTKTPVQISAQVSRETRDLLDEYARQTGMKKGRLIEDALRRHLTALLSVPPEYQVPARIVVDSKAGQRLLEMYENPPPPTPAMKRLAARRKRRNADQGTSS
jgi:uncharacterized protein (DUF1778 family)